MANLPKIRYGMDPGFLKVWELNYEIKIRNVEPQGDCDEKRRTLRGLLSQESSDRSFCQLIDCFEFDIDRNEIKQTLDEIAGLVDKFNGDVTEVGYKRLVSRLFHVSGRISRIKTESDAQQSEQRKLRLQLLTLEGDFDQKIAPQTSIPHSPITDPTFQHFQYSPKPILPYKWNIHFSGTTNKESVISFLEKVESMRIARSVNKDDLFKCAGDLFKSQAWTWYNNNKNRFQSWDQLTQKLKEDFLPYNYDENLLDEIRNRTQGLNEKVSLYIMNMEGLFNRLTVKPSEKSIVDRIRRNLLPHYVSQLALLDIDTIDELVAKCKKVEESLTWSERYKPPTVNKNFSYLEPDLSCPNFYNSHFDNKRNFSRPDDGRKQNFSFTKQVSAVKCWNCSKDGHTHQECRRQKRIFCFGCGLEGVSKPACPKCNGNQSYSNLQNTLINSMPSTSGENQVFNSQQLPSNKYNNNSDSSHFLELFDPNQPPPPLPQDRQKYKKDNKSKNKSRK